MISTVEPATRRGLLDAARTQRQVRDQAEVDLLRTSIEWALAHEVTDPDRAAYLAGYGEDGLTLAGPGAPQVAESAVTELALALGLSSDAGARYLGDALEIRYRLPRLWQRLLEGTCPVWKARRIAAATVNLCEDGAEHVDRHVSHLAHCVSYAQIERLVQDALWRWQPEKAEAQRRAAAEHRHVTIRTHQATTEGTVDLDATLDLADALDLEHALQARATRLRDAGCEEPLPVRRSIALGDLARGQDPLDLNEARSVVLHVHTVADAITHSTSGTGGAHGYERADHGLARLENTRQPISIEQVRTWCHTAATITVRPVLDIAQTIHVTAYETSTAQREQYTERDLTCTFPRCTRPAHRCDAEHRIPWPTGPTDTDNLAPVCRRHHRHKTHHGWTYQTLQPGHYLWTSPHHQHYLRTPTGTHALE